MRSFHRAGKQGFTLVELMIVIVIVGVLAALAVYGVSKYVASSKTAEAKNNIGAISRGAALAYEREVGLAGGVLVDGNTSAVVHQLCGSTLNPPTPAIVKIKGTKYQPLTSDGNDFNTGDSYTGWKCLRFSVDTPIYYAYTYAVTGSGSAAGDAFSVTANGDLNGDGVTSSFVRNGAITSALKVTLSPDLTITNELE
jgi:type IV pilus assembly protein PilA